MTLSEAFLQQVRAALIVKKGELEKSINEEVNGIQGGQGHHLADVEDLASEATDESIVSSIIEMESIELEQIERALDALDDGEYGICDACNEPINIERLEALPFASMCISCKREEEKKNRR